MSSTAVVKYEIYNQSFALQKRFIEVMANLPDCLSGTASSILA